MPARSIFRTNLQRHQGRSKALGLQLRPARVWLVKPGTRTRTIAMGGKFIVLVISLHTLVIALFICLFVSSRLLGQTVVSSKNFGMLKRTE